MVALYVSEIYVCSEITIEWEVVSAASVILPYDLDCSPCLDVSQIKRWLTDAVIGRVITALHAAVSGIITPGGDTIQVVCPLFLGSAFATWCGYNWCRAGSGRGYLISVRGHTVA